MSHPPSSNSGHKFFAISAHQTPPPTQLTLAVFSFLPLLVSHVPPHPQ